MGTVLETHGLEGLTWSFHDPDCLPRQTLHDIAGPFGIALPVPTLASVPSCHLSILVKLYCVFLGFWVGSVSHQGYALVNFHDGGI